MTSGRRGASQPCACDPGELLEHFLMANEDPNLWTYFYDYSLRERGSNILRDTPKP